MEAVEKVNHNIFSPEPFVNVIENKSINTENEQYSIARAFAIGFIISNLNLCRLSRVLEISRFSGLLTEPIISVPESLKNQLKIGGNLIAPVDFDDIESKNLIKITKINENEFTYTKINPLIKFVML
jgi:protein-L-isoaspartate O-methyltransferase